MTNQLGSRYGTGNGPTLPHARGLCLPPAGETARLARAGWRERAPSFTYIVNFGRVRNIPYFPYLCTRTQPPYSEWLYLPIDYPATRVLVQFSRRMRYQPLVGNIFRWIRLNSSKMVVNSSDVARVSGPPPSRN